MGPFDVGGTVRGANGRTSCGKSDVRAAGRTDPGRDRIPAVRPTGRASPSQLTLTFRSTVTWSTSVVRTVVFMVQVPGSGRVRVSEVQ